ncbi:hypothetical protein B484DRAFT_460975 [Ochromonadaceae sp. CCMP2298]|nr:hypothetical protein B484DRAFT_460975 [Ochromonadaceae sp. CCMP2298]
MQIQFQELLGEKSRHLAELQDAYKEKQRKCLAWEKAYVNIRNQVSGREEPESVQRAEDGIPEHLRKSSSGRLLGNPAAYAPESPRRLSQFEEEPYLYGARRDAPFQRLGQGHFLTPTPTRPLSRSYSWGKGPDIGGGDMGAGGRGVERPSFFDGPRDSL